MVHEKVFEKVSYAKRILNLLSKLKFLCLLASFVFIGRSWMIKKHE